MKIREISIGADHKILERFRGGFVHSFGRSTCGVAALFVRHLQQVCGSSGVSKLAFTFSDLVQGPPDQLYELNCWWPFDFTRYVAADPQEKRIRIAESLKDALVWCAPFVVWTPSQVKDVHQLAIRDGLIFEGVAKNSWLSPTRQFRVRIYYRLDLDSAMLVAILSKARGNVEIVRQEIARLIPYDGCLSAYIGAGEWKSEHEFVLTSHSFPSQAWTMDFGSEIRANSE